MRKLTCIRRSVVNVVLPGTCCINCSGSSVNPTPGTQVGGETSTGGTTVASSTMASGGGGVGPAGAAGGTKSASGGVTAQAGSRPAAARSQQAQQSRAAVPPAVRLQPAVSEPPERPQPAGRTRRAEVRLREAVLQRAVLQARQRPNTFAMTRSGRTLRARQSTRKAAAFCRWGHILLVWRQVQRRRNLYRKPDRQNQRHVICGLPSFVELILSPGSSKYSDLQQCRFLVRSFGRRLQQHQQQIRHGGSGCGGCSSRPATRRLAPSSSTMCRRVWPGLR